LALIVACSLLVMAPITSPPAGAATFGDQVGIADGSFLWMDSGEMGRALDRVRSTGARWIRVDFPWSVIQREGPDRFDWSRTDRLVSAANARGIRILALATYSPVWARPNGSSDRHPPRDPDDYARFVGAAARRYGPQGLHHWEIWNEPNLRLFWGREPSVAEYIRLLRPAYRAIHAADSGSFVVTGGLAPAKDERGSISPFWFSLGLAALAGDSFDALGVHPYSFPKAATTPETWNTFFAQRYVYLLLAYYGQADKQIWATEIGWPTGTSATSVSESVQAARLLEAIAAWRAYPFDGPLFVYQWRDRGRDRTQYWQNMGIHRFDGSAKPALNVLRSLLNAES
jgi:polysaccharide biosynthesis protein PslG